MLDGERGEHRPGVVGLREQAVQLVEHLRDGRVGRRRGRPRPRAAGSPRAPRTTDPSPATERPSRRPAPGSTTGWSDSRMIAVICGPPTGSTFQASRSASSAAALPSSSRAERGVGDAIAARSARAGSIAVQPGRAARPTSARVPLRDPRATDRPVGRRSGGRRSTVAVIGERDQQGLPVVLGQRRERGGSAPRSPRVRPSRQSSVKWSGSW